MRPKEQAIPRHRAPFVDVLDRVLAKGIVIVYEIDVSVAGLRVIEMDGRVMAMSLETYLKMAGPPSAEAANSPALISAAQEYLGRLPTGHAPHVMS